MANRNAYRSFTPAQIAELNDATWQNLEFNGIPVKYLIDSRTDKPVPRVKLTPQLAAERLGARLVTVDYVYELDAEGKPILDEKGKPKIADKRLPVYDAEVTVKVEGFCDYLGTPIPKGKQYFVHDRQSGNRPHDTVHRKKLTRRALQWVLNGEVLVKDVEGSGQNEQHRCGVAFYGALEGEPLPPEGLDVITLDGVSVEGSGSIDTGKQKSATDDLGSDPGILPSPKTIMEYRGGSEGYGAKIKEGRAKILRELQGAAKRIILRMSGQNIKASKFSAYDSAGNVMAVCESWSGLDELANMAYAYVQSMPIKVKDPDRYVRPCSIWEVTTALALHALRDSDVLTSPESIAEYDWPTIDLQFAQRFLEALSDGALMSQGVLADWCRDRCSAVTRKMKDESSFAQVRLAVELFAKGEPIPASINRTDVTGPDKESGTKWSYFGGGDRGPIPKAPKAAKE